MKYSDFDKRLPPYVQRLKVYNKVLFNRNKSLDICAMTQNLYQKTKRFKTSTLIEFTKN